MMTADEALQKAQEMQNMSLVHIAMELIGIEAEAEKRGINSLTQAIK